MADPAVSPVDDAPEPFAARTAARSDLTRARLAVALEAAQVGLWEVDPTTGAVDWDARSTAMFGLAGQELTGTVADFDRGIDVRDRARVDRVLEEALLVAGPVDVEFRTRWPDGSEHWIHARGQALVDTDGRVVRIVGTNADVTQARQAAAQQAADAAAMAGLVAVAQALGHAETEAAVLQAVTDHGTPLLGAQAMGLALREPERVRTLATAFHADFLAAVAHLPLGTRLPLVDTATTGRAHYLPDLASTVVDFPDAAAVYDWTGTEASAAVPLLAAVPGAGDGLLGALSVAFATPHRWRPAEQELLAALASLTAQTLTRIAAREAERVADAATAQLAESLQRALLTMAPSTGSERVVVRYVPAAAQAQVGGDWYDAFTTADGTLTVVIGDVTGHDQHAAAAMAQLRNLLRGIAHTTGTGPATVLRALDRAVADLHVGSLASIVVAQFDPPADGTGSRRMRWSNAGHPPPLLLGPGTGTYLGTEPDLLIGVDADAVREDHVVDLGPGARVLLFTDGLVERRGADLQVGLDWLAGAAGDLVHHDDHAVCDELLALVGSDVEDDVALLLVHLDGAGRGRRTHG